MIGIKGYYGFGNLGDDVLMMVSYNIARSLFPDSSIVICTESKETGYIEKLLGAPVETVSMTTDVRLEYIIHGGGGVYFDFKEGNLINAAVNSFIKIIGYDRYRRLYQGYQSARKRRTLLSGKRIGVGIGVGTFTDSSPKFYSSILSLSDFDLLLVRDEESRQNVLKYGFKYPVSVTTDIAFHTSFWLPKTVTVAKPGNSVGFVLRDWTDGDHLEVFLSVANDLRKQGVGVRFYSFDRAADKRMISMLKNDEDLHIWDPTGPLDTYLQSLASNAVVVTSRAHGAILSACLGVPGFCIEIEPKLRNVRQMLSES